MKKMWKRTLSLMLAVLLFCGTLTLCVSAEDDSGYCGSNVRWHYDASDRELIIEGEGEMWNYSMYESPWYKYRDVIKTAFIHYGITSISSYGFLDCINLLGINIPDSVAEIGVGAFTNCKSLTKMIIPGSVKTIRNQAFFHCSKLNYLNINYGVKNIDHSAFHSCASLLTVTIPGSVEYVNELTFAYCTKLQNITIFHILINSV